ncbi:hypothetical protein V4C53_17805 [Paraburkholderia azotifigens]|uniref:hypothetical protein n=1 Tax=Paraburkholderia azotifigens TaxID=2057004 RepID=UPI00316D5742
MMSESSRMIVAGGVLIGALTLAALGLRFGNRESSAKEADGHIDASLAFHARPATSDTPVDDPQNAGIARVLQAVHDCLQSGDLASAHVLLDAVLAMRADEPQALMLQKELAAREAMARTAKTSPPGDVRPATRTHASRKAQHAPMQHAPGTSDDDEALAANLPPPVDIRPDNAKADATENAPQMQAEAVAQTPALTEEPPAQPAASAPAIASGKPNREPPVTAARDAPKTRAEVRDELTRARSDGSLSRFGNPDPYGPGGVPSRDTQPAARNW